MRMSEHCLSSRPDFDMIRIMKMPRSIALLLTNVILCAPVFATTCESLAHLSLANGSITLANSVAPNAFVTDDSHPMLYLPAFCRVAATLTPTPDSNIHIEVWMPTLGWNGKYEGTGNGGYAGKISYGPLAVGLRSGYAVANTDMGTSVPKGANQTDRRSFLWQGTGARIFQRLLYRGRASLDGSPAFSGRLRRHCCRRACQ
jgi:feruloyl esterase